MLIEALLGVLFLALLAIGLRLWHLEKRLKVLLGAGETKSIESHVLTHASEIEDLRKEAEYLRDFAGHLERKSLDAVQKIGMVRFNPFADSGGDQSFVIVLLDAHDNGIALSSLYSQGRPMVYAKPIERGTSRYPLSGEEQDALKIALGK